MYDDTASIGRLYRRQDEIGTLWCITVDVQTVKRPPGHHPRPRHHGPDQNAIEGVKQYLRDNWRG